MEPKDRARQLRKSSTDAERMLWRQIRDRHLGGYKFRRQRPIGPYFVGFVCLEKSLVIELDGGQHAEQITYDRNRDSWLHSQGFRTVRFWNNDVLGDIESVKNALLMALEE